MLEEWVRMFRENFPFAVRRESTVQAVLGDPGNHVEEMRDGSGKLIGVSVSNGDTVSLLCVDRAYRNRGIGSALLERTEAHIAARGAGKIRVGAGASYLTPGVPTDRKVFEESLCSEEIDPRIDGSAEGFFRNRGYSHAWGESNCLNMRMRLQDCAVPGRIGGWIDGLRYDWASPEDVPEVLKCTQDAHDAFTQYYRDPALYAAEGQERVLLARDGDRVAGVLIVGAETEEKGVGSVGCTAVRHGYRGRRIGTNLVALGTGHLRDIGLEEGFLGYTYSGLDRMYGRAGYRICAYYFMAEKTLGTKEKEESSQTG